MKCEQLESLEDLIQKVTGAISTGDWWMYAAFTDELIRPAILTNMHGAEVLAQILSKQERLLELRVCSIDAEYKAFRGDIGKKLRCRVLVDDRLDEQSCYDESQYTDDGRIMTIRNYLSYYEQTGQAYISDWRIVGFSGGGEA